MRKETSEYQVRFYKFYILIWMLGGCAPLPSTYNPQSLPQDQLVKVTPFVDRNFFPENVGAEILRIFNENGMAVIDYQMGTVHDSVFLPEGKYHFMVRCQKPPLLSYPQITAYIETGGEYTIYCQSIIEEDAFLGIDQIRAHRAQIVKSKDFSVGLIQDTYFKDE